jgi:hypothetical protein
MAAPFVSELLGRRSDASGLPNVSDSNSSTSRAISEKLLELLRLPVAGFEPSRSPGTQLERAVSRHLRSELTKLDPTERWDVKDSGNPLTDFAQYRHLADLNEAVKRDDSGTLRIVVGADYLVKPDVTVARLRDPHPVLHASVSCKWTLRSDRAQNARTEARGLLSHRKGRAPHITVVTAEPLPSRLASLGFGTGDIDAVYHICFEELQEAVRSLGSKKEKTDLEVLIEGDRLRDYNSLALVLATD